MDTFRMGGEGRAQPHSIREAILQKKYQNFMKYFPKTVIPVLLL